MVMAEKIENYGLTEQDYALQEKYGPLSEAPITKSNVHEEFLNQFWNAVRIATIRLNQDV